MLNTIRLKMNIANYIMKVVHFFAIIGEGTEYKNLLRFQILKTIQKQR